MKLTRKEAEMLYMNLPEGMVADYTREDYETLMEDTLDSWARMGMVERSIMDMLNDVSLHHEKFMKLMKEELLTHHTQQKIEDYYILIHDLYENIIRVIIDGGEDVREQLRDSVRRQVR